MLPVNNKKTLQQDMNIDKGGVFPLLAIVIIPLIGIIALLIDISIASNAKEDQRKATQNAAIAALSAYLEKLSDCDPDDTATCKFTEAANKALNRAEIVSKVNISPFYNFLEDPDQTPSDFENETSGAYGELEFGFYHFDDALNSAIFGSSSAPCNAECLIIRPFNSTQWGYINNAVKLTTYLPITNPITTLFAKIFGQKEITYKVEAVATVVPYNIFFGIDLSRSMVRSNYLRDGVQKTPIPTIAGCTPPPDVNGDGWADNWMDTIDCSIDGSRSEFAFVMDPSATPSPPPANCPNSDPLTVVTACALDPSYCHLKGSFDREEWNRLPNVPPTATPTEYTARAKSQYYCRYIDRGNGKYDGAMYAYNYLIDYNVPYSGAPIAKTDFSAEPKPFIDMLKGVTSALDYFKKRSVGGDRVGVVGFDSQSYDSTFISLKSINNAKITEAMNAFDVINKPWASNPDFIDYGFFPVYGAYSDLLGAIQLALNDITDKATKNIARNVIALFTDGEANCVNGATPRCLNAGSYIVQAINKINSTLVPLLIDAKVSVVLVITGDAAHYVLRTSGYGSGCMTATEYVEDGWYAKGYSWADSSYNDTLTGTGTWTFNDFLSNLSAADQYFQNSYYFDDVKFYLPAELYYLALATRGLWIPIMEPCVTTGTSSDKDIRKLVWQKCTDALNGGASPGFAMANLSVTTSSGSTVQVTDENGRLLCDLQGLSIEDSIQKALTSFLLDTVFLINPDNEALSVGGGSTGAGSIP